MGRWPGVAESPMGCVVGNQMHATTAVVACACLVSDWPHSSGKLPKQFTNSFLGSISLGPLSDSPSGSVSTAPPAVLPDRGSNRNTSTVATWAVAGCCGGSWAWKATNLGMHMGPNSTLIRRDLRENDNKGHTCWSAVFLEDGCGSV